MRRKHLLSLFMLSMGVALLVAATVVGVAAAKNHKAHHHAKAQRGGNLVVAQAGGAFDTLDPQLAYVSNDWGLLYNTQLLLLNFPTKAGKAGSQLVPEAAKAFPTISKNGKTYTFHLRSGMKFSNGKPVTAAAFQRSFERILSPKMYAQYGIFDGVDVFLVGGQAFAQTGPYACGKTPGPKCSKNPPKHIAGIKAKGLTLTFHLTRRVPQWSSMMGMQWFSAVPPNMPYWSKNASGVLKYASAGPYYLKSNNLSKLTVLKRNPYFHLGSNWPANPDQIIVKSYPNSNGEQQLLQAEKNQIDIAAVPSQEVKKTIGKYGRSKKSRFHVGPTTCITWNALNTEAQNGTTKSLGVRKALNYAVSRKAIISFAGPLSGAPSDQILVPGMPGYKQYSVYPANGSMAKAKAAGGSALNGAPLTIYYSQSSVYQTNVAEYIEAQASKLGMKPTLQAADPDSFYGPLETKSTALGADGYNITAYGGWCADYFDPYDYINVNFDGRTIGDTGNVDYMYFNNAGFDKQMDKAAAASGTKRWTLYAALDKTMMTKFAPLIPTQVGNTRVVTSKRVGNWIYSTYFGQSFWNAITLK